MSRWLTIMLLGAAVAGSSGCEDEGPTGLTTQAAAGHPGAVADLHVATATDTSITLAFTAVGDGEGAPANYEIRMNAAPILDGGCESPMTGGPVGASLSCTVSGLTPSTEYRFDLSALDDDERGPRSNVLRAWTTERGAAAVATVDVAPDSATMDLGATGQFSATARAAGGTPLAHRAYTWRSSNEAVATVSSTGVVTAVGPGLATISATSSGVSGSATVVVGGTAPGTTWPNQPGFSTITDQPFTAVLDDGWSMAYNSANLMTVVQNDDAPHSPSSVLQFTYPAGFNGGASPAWAYRGLPTRERIYVGMWWRANANWQGHPSNVNKMQYLFTNSQGSIFMNLYGAPGGPYELRVFPQFSTSNGQWLTPNRGNGQVTLGEWHRIEWLVEYTGPGRGRVQWWLDGALVGAYDNLAFPTERLVEYKVSPVWGGAGGTKSQTDYFWYDHIRIAGQ